MCGWKQTSVCFIVFLKVNDQEQEHYNLKSPTTFYVPFLLMTNLKGLTQSSTKVADPSTTDLKSINHKNIISK